MINFKKTVIYKCWYPLNSLYKRLGFALIMLSFIPICLEVIGIGMIAPIIIILLKGDISTIPFLSDVFFFFSDYFNTSIVIIGIGLLLSIFLFKALFLTVYYWATNKFLHIVYTDLSFKLFNNYLSKPYIYFSNQNSSVIIKNILSEVGTFVSMIGTVMRLANDIFMMIGIIAFIMFYEIKISSIAIMFFLIIGSIYYLLTVKIIGNWGKIRNKHLKFVIQYVQQGLAAIKELKLYSREKVYLEIFNFHNIKLDWSKKKRLIIQQLPVAFFELFGVILFAILIFFLISQNTSPEKIIATLGVLGFAMIRILPLINRIITIFQSLVYAGRPIDELFNEFKSFEKIEILDKKKLQEYNKSSELINSKPNEIFKNDILISNLSFCYPGKEINIFDNVEFKIEKGKYIGIIGSSGTGKSTFLDLLMGLLEPNSGDIKIDGKTIYNNIKEYRNLFGYVPQNILLIDDTIKKNIVFGITEDLIDEKRLNETIKICELENLINSLPNGIEFIVGENGSKLSGGEKQRIGIARALYHNPGVLILDEATSSLDSITEKNIINSISRIKFDKTIIFVSHKLNSLRECDIIYKVEDKKLKVANKNL